MESKVENGNHFSDINQAEGRNDYDRGWFCCMACPKKVKKSVETNEGGQNENDTAHKQMETLTHINYEMDSLQTRVNSWRQASEMFSKCSSKSKGRSDSKDDISDGIQSRVPPRSSGAKQAENKSDSVALLTDVEKEKSESLEEQVIVLEKNQLKGEENAEEENTISQCDQVDNTIGEEKDLKCLEAQEAECTSCSEKGETSA